MSMNRDLNPSKEAVAAMWLWGKEYSQQACGSMGFWDKLPKSRKDLCKRLVDEIEKSQWRSTERKATQ